MGVSSSESHDLTAFYEMLMASFGVLSQNTGFYPSLDRIVETMLRPLNLGPGGRSYNELISHLQHMPCCHQTQDFETGSACSQLGLTNKESVAQWVLPLGRLCQTSRQEGAAS